jgi:two-component system cell cycle sensor histidine kinase/response regulator CckA
LSKIFMPVACPFRWRSSGFARDDVERGTVLIVDDEILVLEIARDILQRFGYAVLTAESGEQALSLYEQRHQDIDAVVLDLVLPGMDGREVIHKVRELDSNACIVVSSGCITDETSAELRALGVDGFVQKPYRIAELLEAVKGAVRREEEGREEGPNRAS